MSKVRVRCYCQGIGDATLIEIAKPAGGAFWMLIDCGIHSSASGGRAKIDAVVADIASLTRHLDVVVATHEHWDHISGFNTADWSGFTVGEVWLAWTENPADKQARELDRFKSEALEALTGAADRLRAAPDDVLSPGIDALLGFHFGVAGQRSRAARDNVVALAPNAVRYLEPGQALPLPVGLGVTAYVLGPPRDLAALGVRDGANSYGIAESLSASFAITDGAIDTDDDAGAPFDETEGLVLSGLPADDPWAGFFRDRYTGLATGLPKAERGDPDPPRRDQAWRRIDGDWLAAAATLALQLDDRTNNTSLVLALSLDEEVLLFAADAQLGNWGSWGAVSFPDGVTGPDLLARTSFYKAGHHGSSNATLRTGGLEAMTRPGLQSFIPTDETMAKKVGWGAIPAPGLVARLAEKGSVTRSDQSDGALAVDFRFGGEQKPKVKRRNR